MVYCREHLMCAVGIGLVPPPPIPDDVPWWGETDLSHYQDERGFYRSPPVKDGRGWPFVAMWCELSRVEPQNNWQTNFSQGGISLTQLGLNGNDRWPARSMVPAFPLRIIWPSFALNSFFYAAILWLLTLGPFTARRMTRRKSGLCIKCGYDLNHADHSVCPECGWRRDADYVKKELPFEV